MRDFPHEGFLRLSFAEPARATTSRLLQLELSPCLPAGLDRQARSPSLQFFEMRHAALVRPASQLLGQLSAARTIASSASKRLSNFCAPENPLSWSAQLVSARRAPRFGIALLDGQVLCRGASKLEQVRPAALSRSYVIFGGVKGQGSAVLFDRPIIEPVVRRPANVTGVRRMSAYRRDPSMRREPEEDTANIDLDPAKMLEKGSPGTYQAIVRDVMPVGYFLTMPSGREAYLPATDIGTTGGMSVLERIFKPGQELTVRITSSIPRRDIVSIKKEGMVPEMAKPGYGLGGGTTGSAGSVGSTRPRNR